MNDAQTRSIIGVLTAVVTSMVIGTFTIDAFTIDARTMKTQFDAMNTSMNARFDAAGEVVSARFDSTDHRIDSLDRDIHVVTSRVFGAGDDRI